jgi:hypothetical protein
VGIGIIRGFRPARRAQPGASQRSVEGVTGASGGIVGAEGIEGGGVPWENLIRRNVVLDNDPADRQDLTGATNWRNNRCRTRGPPNLCSQRND